MKTYELNQLKKALDSIGVKLDPQQWLDVVSHLEQRRYLTWDEFWETSPALSNECAQAMLDAIEGT